MDLALTPDNRWEYATADLVSAASNVGFAAVGINSVRVDADAAGMYVSSGMRCHELLALVVSDDETATIAAAEQLAEAAEVMDAGWVLTVFTTAPTENVVRHCADVLSRASGWRWSSARSALWRRSPTGCGSSTRLSAAGERAC